MPLVFESIAQYARDFQSALSQNSLGETEFLHGVGYVLGGFLTHSSQISLEQRIAMARVLQDIFGTRASAALIPDKDQRSRVVAAFGSLVHDYENNLVDKALQRFSKRPEVKALLVALGLT
jgi:hypothetical protein